VITRAAEEFGGIDVLVSNTAFQMTHSSLDEISDEERVTPSGSTFGPISIWARRSCHICHRGRR
jgi:NAD(P)-dependent dehydrogenase (short-subunit alcohol dehydrogenase family)